MANRKQLLDLLRRYGWLLRIRPQSLAEPLYRLVKPSGGRAIIEACGVRLFVDPLTTLGSELVTKGTYEEGLVELVRAKLPVGGTFLDIGANEGVISAVAAERVGSGGLVIAVEPQSRLRDILEINLSLNGRGCARIIEAAIAERDGQTVTVSLGPSSHSGGSSLVNRYRWSRKSETVTGRTVDSIVRGLNGRHVDFMKIDVEGYEPEAIRSARSSLAGRMISCLAVDFHNSILTRRGVDPLAIDGEIRGHGYVRESGDPRFGYVVYTV